MTNDILERVRKLNSERLQLAININIHNKFKHKLDSKTLNRVTTKKLLENSLESLNLICGLLAINASEKKAYIEKQLSSYKQEMGEVNNFLRTMSKLMNNPELVPFISRGFMKQDHEVFQRMSGRLIESSRAEAQVAKDLTKEIAEKHEKELELQKILRVADKLLVGNEVVEPLAKLLINNALNIKNEN